MGNYSKRALLRTHARAVAAGVLVRLGFSLSMTICFPALFVSVRAEAPAERTLMISEQIHFSGDVQRVVMVVAAGGRILESKHVAWIDQPDTKEVTGVGQVTLRGGEEILQILFVVFGGQGEVRSSFKTISVNEVPPTWFLSSSQLRDRLVERRGALRQLQSEVRLQEERLRTLQEDADAIANIAKIVSAEDELKEVQAKIRRVEAAFESIQQRTMQMKARPVPLNAQKREAELVRQLGTLSAALAATETNALKGISAASAELKHKLQMIEEANEEHVVLLEEELAQLQHRKR